MDYTSSKSRIAALACRRTTSAGLGVDRIVLVAAGAHLMRQMDS